MPSSTRPVSSWCVFSCQRSTASSVASSNSVSTLDLLVRVEAQRHEVLLQLAHVEAVVDPVLQGAPGRLAAREPEHRRVSTR